MKHTPLLLVFIISLILGWQLLRPGYFSMHDDLQVMRVYQMDRCFQDGQIPCRWSPDMANNYGQPMFNYYSAFPYYLGQLIHQFGFSYISVVKLLFLLSIVVSGLSMYWLSVQFVSSGAALLSAILYLTAPYYALDIFVRGALSEIWGLSLLPLVLATAVYLVRRPTANRAIIMSLSLAAFLTTHNITTLISIPLIGFFFPFIWLSSPNKRKNLIYLTAATLLGVGLSAFFTLPVIFERNLIQSQSLISNYFNFRAHFVTIKQLFLDFSWGYGPSRFGPNDGMSFAIGLVHSLALIGIPYSIFHMWSKKDRRRLGTLAFFLIAFSVSIFLTHSRSIFVWESLPLLAYLQFPWRFLGLVALANSIIFALQVDLLGKRPRQIVVACLVVVLVGINIKHFKFKQYFPQINDQQKLQEESYNLQIRAAINDYLPLAARKTPSDKAPNWPEIINGDATVSHFDKRSAYFSAELDVRSQTATVQFPVIYFPNWTVYHNRSANPSAIDTNNDLGLITMHLDKGKHLIQAWFENTPIRALGNIFTFTSAFLLLLWSALGQRSLPPKKSS